jgi:predicted nucleotidyltransferase component of viral defense system
MMQAATFRQFNLVGGTALALQMGHRVSIDLDLFTYEEFDNAQLLRELQDFGTVRPMFDKPPFLQVLLDGLKLDFLQYPYPFVQEFIEIEGVRLVPIENIAVMKLLEIARRGSKKDFFDLYFLLEKYNMKEIVQLLEAKLPNIDAFHILKSLTFFEDAELEINPKMLKKVSWSAVKKSISKKVTDYLNQER